MVHEKRGWNDIINSGDGRSTIQCSIQQILCKARPKIARRRNTITVSG